MTTTQLLVRMRDRADLSSVTRMPRGVERRVAAWDALGATAQQSQTPVAAALEAMQGRGEVSAYRSMRMPNALVVDVSQGHIDAVRGALMALRGVDSVDVDGEFLAAAERSVVRFRPARLAEPTTSPRYEWSLTKVGANDAHARGHDGAGVTVGIVDSGLDVDVSAIRHAYRGTRADGSLDHDRNWFDPVNGRPEPRDRLSHGTLVASFVAGRTDERVTGVAPGARLIAATGLADDGMNHRIATLRALEFMLAPTRTDGTDPDPRVGADIVNCSWGNDDVDDASMRESVDALRAAGTLVVAAAGNEGPAEQTIDAPAAYPGVIAVAATTRDDIVASFSSRGTATDPSAPRPVLAAPGEAVVGISLGSRVRTSSGTSLAAPHVAGALAVLMQAAPDASEQELVDALTTTARDVGPKGPDAGSGSGRIDVDRALDALLTAR